MVYRKRSTRIRRRPRRTTRRPTMRRSRNLNKLNIHHFKRTDILPTLNTATADSFGTFYFSLSDLVNYTEFTNLFDMYRINKVVVKMVPNVNSAEAGAAQRLPQIHSVLDYNDRTIPTTLNELVQYQNYRMTMGSRIHTRILTPASLDVVDSEGGTTPTSARPRFKNWISTSDATLEHYGIKYCIGATASANAVSYTPYITYYISCKSVK